MLTFVHRRCYSENAIHIWKNATAVDWSFACFAIAPAATPIPKLTWSNNGEVVIAHFDVSCPRVDNVIVCNVVHRAASSICLNPLGPPLRPLMQPLVLSIYSAIDELLQVDRDGKILTVRSDNMCYAVNVADVRTFQPVEQPLDASMLFDLGRIVTTPDLFNFEESPLFTFAESPTGTLAVSSCIRRRAYRTRSFIHVLPTGTK